VSDPRAPNGSSDIADPSLAADSTQTGEDHRGRLLRADKIMQPDEIEAFLQSAFCGRTASVDRQGYPYVLPNLFTWIDGQVYQQTARRAGHFLANIRHSDRVCFETDSPAEVFPYGHVECDTSVAYTSAVVFGRIRIVENEDEQRRFFTSFMAKYAPPDSWGREQDSFPRMSATIVFAITAEVITGKRGRLPAVSDRWPLRNLTLSPNWKPRDAPPEG